MIFTPTAIAGAFRVEQERHGDERGFFARTFCREEFEAQGIRFQADQCSTSFNKQRGTLRGMHYQVPPHEEMKLVRCTRGVLFDVAVDLRPGSPTYGRYAADTLSAENGVALLVPAGCAHGFLTLADDTEILYTVCGLYHPESARGARWDDPLFSIAWPEKPRIISERDRNWPLLGAGLKA